MSTANQDRTTEATSFALLRQEASGQLPRPALRVALSATFTVEPIEPALLFWLHELGYDGELSFAPYNQVLQQLLDPTSALANGSDLNVVALRWEDALRFASDEQLDTAQHLTRACDDLCEALTTFAARCATPSIVWVGPASERAQQRYGALFGRLTETLRVACQGAGQLSFLASDDVQRYAVASVYDERRDAIGHIPYTPGYFAALATALARRVYALKAPPVKVIAVDCDNTLWQGVVGEEGVHGITLPPGKLALQRALIAQQQQGALICLVSKNTEDDVLAVFRERADMLLKLEHVVAHRVNWVSKAENIASLADELSLGVDSFLFIDDNPVECAEMKAAQPLVSTLQLPEDDEVQSFLDNLWAFDRLHVTEEDQKRTLMYQQNRERMVLEKRAPNIQEFLRTLALHIDIAPVDGEQLARVAQLTQRTNQFNFTTKRRSEAEVSQLNAHGLECLRANVADRFGDYGLVGVMIFGQADDTLHVDTMLLSCRVLGRGVEHRMLAELGTLALQRGLKQVRAPFVASKKNLPARNFLESIAFAHKQERDGTTVYTMDAALLHTLRYQPGEDAGEQLEFARTGGGKSKAAENATPSFDRSRALQRISSELTEISAVERAIEERMRVARPTLAVAYVAPRSELEQALCEIWQRILNIENVGVHDDFNELGGSSLQAAELFVQIEERFGVKLPMTTILTAGTISQLEQTLERPRAAERQTLKLLRTGIDPLRHLFLVHDGDGETLLYMNLARRLPAQVNVWGLEPLASGASPIAHTRMRDMAAYYVSQVQKVQPTGPYQLGGMCAGGTIAFEMALQLESAGHEVALVALIDAADAKAKRVVARESQHRLRRLWKTLRGEKSGAKALPEPAAAESVEPRVERAPNRLSVLSRKLGNVLRYEARKLQRTVLDTVRFHSLQRALDKRANVPSWVGALTVRSVYERLERDYTPHGKLRGQAVLYRATWRHAPDVPLIDKYRDPLLGWIKRLSAELHVCDVPGGHSSMLQEPQVAPMADDLAMRVLKPARTKAHRRDNSPSHAPDLARVGRPVRA